jgi:hypothetical protein
MYTISADCHFSSTNLARTVRDLILHNCSFKFIIPLCKHTNGKTVKSFSQHNISGILINIIIAYEVYVNLMMI